MNQRIKTFIAAGLLALALFGAARAGPLEDAKAAAQRADYATELQILRPLADQGNAEAQNWVGWIYDQGKGVAKDYVEAKNWYRKAADQGNTDAQNNLGSMYHSGRGVPQDYAQAVAWYRQAAERGTGEGSLWAAGSPHR